MKQLVAIGLLTAALASVTTANAAPVVIDSFDTTDQSLSLSGKPRGPKSTSGVFKATEAIGGQRDIVLNRTSPAPNAGTVDEDINLSVPGALSYSSGTGTTGSLLLTWDGMDSSPTAIAHNLGPVDLTAGGTNTGIGFLAGTDAPSHIAPLTFSLYSGPTNWSKATVSLMGGPTSYFLPWSNFMTMAGSGADPRAVSAIQMYLDGNVPGTDVQIGAIRATNLAPEPATMALLGMGVVPLICRLGRRQGVENRTA